MGFLTPATLEGRFGYALPPRYRAWLESLTDQTTTECSAFDAYELHLFSQTDELPDIENGLWVITQQQRGPAGFLPVGYANDDYYVLLDTRNDRIYLNMSTSGDLAEEDFIFVAPSVQDLRPSN